MKDNQPSQKRCFAAAWLSSFQPQWAAAQAGCADGVKLLASPAVQREIALQRDQCDIGRADVLRQLARLAFGRANDCVRLVLQPELDPEQLDLSLLAELRRSDKGAVELKLLDRIRALQALLEAQLDREDCAEAFFAAAEEVQEP